VFAARILLAQRQIALLLCVATLLFELLVPTGYMIDNDYGRLTFAVCSGVEPRTMTMEMPGMRGDMPDHGKPKYHGKAEMPCALSGLSAAALGAIDPIQLAALIAFAMAVGIIGFAVPPPLTPTYLRPPLRGPSSYL
jgi:hypothetical protein